MSFGTRDCLGVDCLGQAYWNPIKTQLGPWWIHSTTCQPTLKHSRKQHNERTPQKADKRGAHIEFRENEKYSKNTQLSYENMHRSNPPTCQLVFFTFKKIE